MELTNSDIQSMRASGSLTASALKYAGELAQPGITTYELDKKVHEFIISKGGIPAFYKYEGFPNACCISVNEVVVHGVPSKDIVLKEGDIVSVDFGTIYKGVYSDAARTFPVGKITKEKQDLIDVTKQSFFEAIKVLKVGATVGDVGQAVQNTAEKHGYGVVRELVGHGIGHQLHMEPQIPNYGTSGTGYVFKENTAVCIEPMINMGTKDIYISEDGWTITTRDNKPSAHYENTVLITKNGVEILTLWFIVREI